MKSVKEINAIITKLVNEVKAYEEQGDKFTNEAKALYNSWRGTTSRFENREDDPEYIKYKKLHQDADAAYIKAAETNKIIVVWRFNLMHAKKAELLPVWVEVMKAYEGKQIGKARENEIREKLKSLGITGYFSKYAYSSPKISLSYLNGGYCYGSDYIELSGDYNITFWDNNNRFVMPDLSSFKFYGESTPYIENPKQYIKQLERAAAKARTAAAVYNKVLHDYNAAAIPGFRQIETYHDNPGSVAEYFRITK